MRKKLTFPIARLRLFICLILVLGMIVSCSRQATSRISLPNPKTGAVHAQVENTPTLLSSSTTPTPENTTTSPLKPTRQPTQTPTTYLTSTPTITALAPAAVSAPILLYHHISNTGGSYRYAVSKENFRKQMKLLSDLGFHTVTISELVDAVSSGSSLPEKSIILTFDDGFMDVYENAFPILQEFGFIATTYIIAGVIDSDLSYGYMQPQQLNELAQAGWEIGNHSLTHTDLKDPKLDLNTELDHSREILEEKIGIEIHSFAYPYASANAQIREMVKNHGYQSAVGVGVSNLHTMNNLFFLSRREVYNNTTLQQFKELLTLPVPTATPLP